MKNFREQMLSRMIRIYGFEHEITQAFAKIVEMSDIPDETLELLVTAHEQFPVDE